MEAVLAVGAAELLVRPFPVGNMSPALKADVFRKGCSNSVVHLCQIILRSQEKQYSPFLKAPEKLYDKSDYRTKETIPAADKNNLHHF